MLVRVRADMTQAEIDEIRKPEFYVYVWYRADGSPCYVGKGKGNRWREHSRKSGCRTNSWLRRIFAKDGKQMRCELIARELCEDHGHELERFLIGLIGRRATGGPLVNATDGGEGVCGFVFSEISRRKMQRRADLTGQRFGRLTALRCTGALSPERRHIMWQCICDCGTEVEVAATRLSRGQTKSCGCLQREIASSYGRRHWLGRS